jgi:hypothetical protein
MEAFMPPKFTNPVVVVPLAEPAGLTGTAPGSGPGVRGIGKDGDGVDGNSDSGDGVAGFSSSGSGVSGSSKTGPGLWGYSETGEGLYTEISSSSYAVVAYNRMKNPFPGIGVGFGLEVTGPGGAIYGEAAYGHAGYFAGKVHVVGHHEVTGDITASGNVTVKGDIFLPGADCSEHFDISGTDRIEPGTVVVIDEQGGLRQSLEAYDKRVAGVVSGAGEYKAGIVLDKRPAGEARIPVALVGKVYCKADAEYSPIEVGDLLTTSPTAGHAMKADDPFKAFGAVIGKALRPLPKGQGLIPILIALQ